MLDRELIEPLEDETPSSYVDRIGQLYISITNMQQRKYFAQYFTSLEVASFMAKFCKPNKKVIRILDPGAGAGILGCTLCEHIADISYKTEGIELTAYEVDNALIPYLEKSLRYTNSWLEKRNVRFSYKIKAEDFILENTHKISNMKNLFEYQHNENKQYDIIISNPPYFKIPKSDLRARAADFVVHGQPNIYALFMAVSACLLEQGGELIFITPRSYAAGSYFRLFREKFFAIVRPVFFHLFGSRSNAFDRDNVLQENIIIRAKRQELCPSGYNKQTVIISFSQGSKDLREARQRELPLTEIIDLRSKNAILRIPISIEEEEVTSIVSSWKGGLHVYGMEISTGPVVPFRAASYITDKEKDNDPCVPLLWLQHVKSMSIQWPVNIKKQQYIRLCDESMSVLLMNKNYVLLRRFSAKEEQRRLTAAPFIAERFNTDFIGIENHLNYIYRLDSVLSLEELYGLSALYNSRLLNIYFSTFNGNTQVSATELRYIPLPPLEIIKKIGRHILNTHVSAYCIDNLIDETFNIDIEKKSERNIITYG
ncbi:MAG: Eco57I restriction-modification methylase domain-containing protein [Nitrospirae bacterium]|nr:Eco57I restriction-modification methylase domain-containing protein [Nitrospirota bacterium]